MVPPQQVLAKPIRPVLRSFEERPLFPIALYLMLGIFTGIYFQLPVNLGLLILLALALFASILYALHKNILLPAVLLAFVAGITLFCAALPRWAADPWAPPDTVNVSGRIVDSYTVSDGHACFIIDGVMMNGQPLEGRVSLITLEKQTPVHFGTLSSKVVLERPQPSLFYAGFNARGYYMRQGIRFQAFAASAFIIEEEQQGLLALPQRARDYTTTLLNTYLSPQSAALVDALLSGNRDAIDGDIKDAFSRLGVAHLLAVSGLNITLTAGAAWLLLRKLRLPMVLATVGSIVVLLCYVLFAGLTPSVERAAVMWLTIMGARLAARRYDPLSALSAAAVGLLALRPLDLFDAGFQLSFAATAAILLWAVPLARKLPENRLMKSLGGAMGITAAVQLMALPMLLWYFNNLSVFSPIANLLLVPASFVMQLAGTALLFAGFSPGVAGLLGSALDGYTGLYLGCVRSLSQSAVNIAAASPNGWLMAVYGSLALALSPSVFRAKPRFRAAMAVALAVMAVFLLTPFSRGLSYPDDAVVLAERSGLSLYWQENGLNYVACDGDWTTARIYLGKRGITELAGLYCLDRVPPVTVAFFTGTVHVRQLYVPGRWLEDRAAEDFLNQAMAMNMEPVSARSGPYDFEDDGKSAVLTVTAAGRSIAFVPYALKEDFPQVSQQASGAGFVALNIPANRAGPLLSLCGIKTVALPGRVADTQVTAYNMKECGSIALQPQRILPWIGEWADGIQGNFR